MDVHPSGDHLIVGGYDRKLCWFDLELSEKPYRVLRYLSDVFAILEPTYPTSLDTIRVQFVPCNFIRHTPFSLHHPTTAQYKSSIQGFTTTS